MAENNQQRAAVTAAFPPPPPFWKHFTPTNVEKLEEIKKEAMGKDEAEPRKEWAPAALRALSLPPELGYLVPPEPPTAGSYKLFSEWINISTEPPSLQDQGVEQLYPSPPDTDAERGRSPSGAPARPLNHAYYLLKISKSLLLNFLEFVGLLAVTPQDYEPKMMDIHNLFINAHHLLNLYRPHQARESLIVMMEEQLAKSKEEIREMDRVKEKVESVLEQLRLEGVEHESTRQRSLRENGDDSDLPEQERRGLEEAKELWKLLDELDD